MTQTTVNTIIKKVQEILEAPSLDDIYSAINSDVLSSEYDIIVFSHLRWDFVTQRPQHIINRLSKGRKVLFVEEPIAYNEKNEHTARIARASENITIMQPRISWENLIPELAQLISSYAEQHTLQHPILWFYSAAFSGIIPLLEHNLVVYDCMDELAAFKGASTSLITQEKNLLRVADVVFTGGKSLYESKRKYHANVHCFPSSVDKAHFEKVLNDTTLVPADLVAIPGPIAGFYGVIDERIDAKLLKHIARQLPHISFVMIGPVVKISENDLPHLANIHYLGNKSYSELPNYLKGIDVTMMPFALNKSTQFISPTKTLEFMAAHKPIVSTPIFDVVRDYKKEVAINSTAKGFAHAITKYLHETDLQKQKRIQLQKAVIKRTSWDNTVLAMKQIIKTTLDKRSLQEARTIRSGAYPSLPYSQFKPSLLATE